MYLCSSISNNQIFDDGGLDWTMQTKIRMYDLYEDCCAVKVEVNNFKQKGPKKNYFEKGGEWNRHNLRSLEHSGHMVVLVNCSLGTRFVINISYNIYNV